ncbi:MAG: PAS domain S-box protein, partial [bacterium]|nr:PAS domain S-box protein [bacterium]
MPKYPATYDELLALDNMPVVAIDQQSMFTYINAAFTKEYGWTEKELIGKSVVEIMPAHMRNAHTVGFARYLATETSELLGKPLPLSVLYKDGTVKTSVHYILGDKKDSAWRFASIIDYP